MAGRIVPAGVVRSRWFLRCEPVPELTDNMFFTGCSCACVEAPGIRIVAFFPILPDKEHRDAKRPRVPYHSPERSAVLLKMLLPPRSQTMAEVSRRPGQNCSVVGAVKNAQRLLGTRQRGQQTCLLERQLLVTWLVEVITAGVHKLCPSQLKEVDLTINMGLTLAICSLETFVHTDWVPGFGCGRGALNFRTLAGRQGRDKKQNCGTALRIAEQKTKGLHEESHASP